MKGYEAPDGNWYKSPEDEIKRKQECVECQEDFVNTYTPFWKYLGKPSTVYFALRAVGHLAGLIKLDPASQGLMRSIDQAAFLCFYIGGTCKLAEILCKLDLRSAKKDLQKSLERLGLENKVIPMKNV